MRKRVALITILFTMISVFIFNCNQSITYIAEEDEIIELHSYIDKKSV